MDNDHCHRCGYSIQKHLVHRRGKMICGACLAERHFYIACAVSLTLCPLVVALAAIAFVVNAILN